MRQGLCTSRAKAEEYSHLEKLYFSAKKAERKLTEINESSENSSILNNEREGTMVDESAGSLYSH